MPLSWKVGQLELFSWGINCHEQLTGVIFFNVCVVIGYKMKKKCFDLCCTSLTLWALLCWRYAIFSPLYVSWWMTMLHISRYEQKFLEFDCKTHFNTKIACILKDDKKKKFTRNHLWKIGVAYATCTVLVQENVFTSFYCCTLSASFVFLSMCF